MSVHFNENHKVFMAKDTFHGLPVQLFKTINIEVFCSSSFLIVKVPFLKNISCALKAALLILNELKNSFKTG